MNYKKIFSLVILTTIIFYAIFLFILDATKLENYNLIFNTYDHFFVFIFVILSWFPLYLRWKLLCRNIEIEIPFRFDFLVYISGFALSITPGKIGELIRTQILKDKYQIKRSKTTPIIFIEKFYDLLGAVIVSLFGFLFFPQIGLIILTGLILTVIIFSIFSSKTVFEKTTIFLSKFKFTKKFAEPLSKSHEILKISTRPKVFITSIILSVLYWLLITSAVFYILKSVNTNLLGFPEVASTYTTSLFLGAISFLPAGLGITEGSFIGLLHLQGISLSVAAVAVIIIRIFTLWFNVIIGFIALKIVGGFSINHSD